MERAMQESNYEPPIEDSFTYQVLAWVLVIVIAIVGILIVDAAIKADHEYRLDHQYDKQ
jgi:hypothetical protein